MHIIIKFFPHVFMIHNHLHSNCKYKEKYTHIGMIYKSRKKYMHTHQKKKIYLCTDQLKELHSYDEILVI